ncbi:MAG TPA: hypothetical protein VKB34_10020 [Povalibacter sp.]|nr:hypothetical protein [Povalibacter sp.]
MNRRETAVFAFLVTIGTLQMAADVLAMPGLKAIAAATQVSPAMRVFTAHQGYETHAARFRLSWRDPSGAMQELQLDPQSYAAVRGPYNRRNVYGAAFAYGPLLRADPRLRPMQESVMRYAFCSPGALRSELGIPADASELGGQVLPVRKLQRTDLELSWEIHCHD